LSTGDKWKLVEDKSISEELLLGKCPSDTPTWEKECDAETDVRKNKV
jgi:hypothetical protein